MFYIKFCLITKRLTQDLIRVLWKIKRKINLAGRSCFWQVHQLVYQLLAGEPRSSFWTPPMAFLMYIYQLIMMNGRLISSSLTTTAAATCLAGVQKHRADQTDPNIKQKPPLLNPVGKCSKTSVKYLGLLASSSPLLLLVLLPFIVLLLLSRLSELPDEQRSPVVPVSFHRQLRAGSQVSASSQKQSTVWGIARPSGEPADKGRTHLPMTENRGTEGEKTEERRVLGGKMVGRTGDEEGGKENGKKQNRVKARSCKKETKVRN